MHALKKISDDLSLLRMKAAMYATIGLKTDISQDGYDIIFLPGYRKNGPRLSRCHATARSQLLYAGIDPYVVNEGAIRAYTIWYDAMYEARRIADATITLSSIFKAPRQGTSGVLGYYNRVTLADGWGQCIESSRIECLDLDGKTLPVGVGYTGAYRRYINRAGIKEAILRIRRIHPEFAEARIVDRNSKATSSRIKY